MSSAPDKQYTKILDYLESLTKTLHDVKDDLREFKKDTATRFDSVHDDLATLKGGMRRMEERQILIEQSTGILQDADRARQDDIRQLDIRLSRIEDRLKSNPAPH